VSFVFVELVLAQVAVAAKFSGENPLFDLPLTSRVFYGYFT
jgi:hypothetical protein